MPRTVSTLLVRDALGAHTGAPVVVDASGSAYSRANDVWHVVTANRGALLGFELHAALAVKSDEPPTWAGDALQRLANDLEGMSAQEALLQRGVRIGAPYFPQTQRLVPVAVGLWLSAEDVPIVVVDTFGLFLDEVEALRGAGAHELPALLAHFSKRAPGGQQLGGITQARDAWRFAPPAGVGASLASFLWQLDADAKDVLSAMLARRAAGATVDAVMGLQHPDALIGLATVVQTVEGSAWEIAGLTGVALGVGVRARFDGGAAPPLWLRESWSWLVRAFAVAESQPVEEPVNKAALVFREPGREASAFILVRDETWPAGADGNVHVTALPLFDAEMLAATGWGRNDELVSGLRAATPGLLANLDRLPVVLEARATHHRLRLEHMELDEDDDGAFVVVDLASASLVGNMLRSLGTDGCVQLVGVDGYAVTMERTEGGDEVVARKDEIFVRASGATWAAMATALAGGRDVLRPLRMLVMA